LKKNPFELESYLAAFDSIDIFFVLVTDAVTKKIENIGGAFEQLTGYERIDFLGGSYEILLNRLQNKDKKRIRKTTERFLVYLNNQPIGNRHAINLNRTMAITSNGGNVLQILVQSIPILFNKEMQPEGFLNIVSDITHLKKKGNNSNYIIDSNDETFIKKILLDTVVASTAGLVSKAEMRVLELMADGCSSKAIASILFLSEHTVKKHRKNMLFRCGCATSSALIKLAMTEKWI